MARQPIQTNDAPRAIGAYSQAVRAGNTVYISGQIGLDPQTMVLAEGVDTQIQHVFRNLRAVAAAAGATLDDAVKVTVFLTDMGPAEQCKDKTGKPTGIPDLAVQPSPAGAKRPGDAKLERLRKQGCANALYDSHIPLGS
jgi:reactive intermediate/imine deaminase